MNPTVELHIDPDDPDARQRLSDALLAAAQYAQTRRDAQPARSQDCDTARYAWASLTVQLAVAAHRARGGT